MKKRKFVLPLAALMLSFTLAACGGGKGGDASSAGPAGGSSNQPQVSSSAEPGPGPASNSSSGQQEKIQITAANDKKNLIFGETVQLTPSVDGVTWSSNKPEIADVSATGLVTAKGKGSATISAKKEGYRDGTISIKVDFENITVTAANDKTTLVMEETVQLTADKEGVTWSSGDVSVASVSETGLVTANAAGETTIYAKKDNYNDGKIVIKVTRPAALATLHFEDADHYSVDGWWGTAAEGWSPIYARTDGNASDQQCIAHLDAGDKETLTFTSSAAIQAELVMTMASSGGVADMSAVMSAKLNNADLAVPAKEFSTGSSSEFAEFSLGNANLVAGDNVLELTFLESAPYIDDLAIYSKQASEIAIKAAPAKDQIEVKLAEGETGLQAYIGEETQIELNKPTSLEGVTFASDKESVAIVADDGKVTGVALGTANITIKKDGMYSARVEVTVEKRVLQGEIRVEAEDTTNELPSGFHKYTDKTSGISNGHSGSAYITGYDVNSACSLEYAFESPKDQTMTLIICGAPHYQMTEPFVFATDCVIKLNDEAITPAADAQIEPGSTMGAATVEITIGDVNVKAGSNTFVIEFIEKAPALDCYRFMPKA